MSKYRTTLNGYQLMELSGLLLELITEHGGSWGGEDEQDMLYTVNGEVVFISFIDDSKFVISSINDIYYYLLEHEYNLEGIDKTVTHAFLNGYFG